MEIFITKITRVVILIVIIVRVLVIVIIVQTVLRIVIIEDISSNNSNQSLGVHTSGLGVRSFLDSPTIPAIPQLRPKSLQIISGASTRLRASTGTYM